MKKVTAEDHGLSDAELTTINAILAAYRRKIDKACLFGSRACGQYKTYSDIDLVLYGNLEECEVDRIKRHIDAMAKVLFTRQEISG